MKLLVTGSSGFIGFHTCKFLLDKKIEVLGIDNNNSYYDKKLKINRLDILNKYKKFKFLYADISKFNKKQVHEIFKFKPTHIIHLAAQPGVRFSIVNPEKNFQYNIRGFFNIMELAKKIKIKHLLFASSSSVYGNQNKRMKENLQTDNPVSFYAATKKTNEVMAYSFSSIYKLRCSGLRFFTVYGPYGRPDMAPFIFANSIINNKKIKLNNYGNHSRDFTYIDDVTKALYNLLKKPSKHKVPFQILNIGSGKKIKLIDFVKKIEMILGLKAKITFTKFQQGDVKDTFADNTKINQIIKFNPIKLEIGLKKFLKWYKVYYK